MRPNSSWRFTVVLTVEEQSSLIVLNAKHGLGITMPNVPEMTIASVLVVRALADHKAPESVYQRRGNQLLAGYCFIILSLAFLRGV